MNGILGMTEVALGSAQTVEQKEQLATIHESAQSLLTILNDILDFSKIEARRLEINPVSFHVRDLIHKTARLFATKAAEKGIELTSVVSGLL